MLPLKAIQLSMIYDTAWRHADICGLHCHRQNILMWVVCAATWDHVDVLGLCCHWRLRWCSCPVKWQRTMLMTMVCTAIGDHVELRSLACADVESPVDISCPCCHWKLCINSCLCSHCLNRVRKLLFTMIQMTADSQLRKREIEWFVKTPNTEVTV